MADNTILNAGTGGDTIATDDIGGIKYQRVKPIHGPDGTNDGDVSKANPLPVFHIHTGRTEIQYSAVGAAAGATGVETLITLTRASGTAATTTGSSFVVTSGKRFRITSITFASRGNATATIQATIFSLRINTAGAITTASPIRLSARTATPATASAWDRFTVSLPDSGIEFVGDGTMQWGITANAVFATNAPTWDVLVTGFEY